MRVHSAPVVQQASSYRWYILTLATLTFTFVMGIPAMSLPVLFEEIARELRLTLVQVGWIWGIGAVLGIVVGLTGGPVSDRLGPRRTLTGACLLMGLMGAARGLTWNFPSLAAAMFFMGFAQSAIPMNIHKTCGIWFPGPRLGTANGVVSVGMACGFMLGSLLAATVFSPWLGGWRHVFFVYGGVALLFSLLWWLSQEKAADANVAYANVQPLSLAAALGHVTKIPNVWRLSLATLGVTACINGLLGYLPLYLRDLGWPEATADSALAAFHAVSMVAAIPIALFSDRLGARKGVLMAAALLVTIGVGLLALVQGALIWPAVMLAGVVRDGYMAITMTAVMEIKGIGARYAGTATGVLMAVMGVGAVLAPPVGNSLAGIGLSVPFVFWAGLALLGLAGYWFVRES
ncbi:MAG: MFS transporter [Caldilinea sp. CFX5]|nr:MFS transporter [Caldilinea sp. CFX5]